MAEYHDAEEARLLQAYLDDRLSARERAEVAIEIARSPALAQRMQQLRRDAELLQAIGQEILEEPVPARLQAILRAAPPIEATSATSARTQHRRLATAAALLLFLSGTGAGWIANDLVNPAPSVQQVILASVAQAFDFYDASVGYPLEFPADRAADLRSWITQAFARDIEPPDLQEFGYAFDGGRLLPGGGVRVGAFQFSRPEKGRLGVFFWPDEEALPALLTGRLDPDTAYRVWSGNGFAVAVMGREENDDLEPAAEAVFAFYRNVFGTSL